jgi:glycosyltransferase involved in cell wall biosynthesis
VTVRFEAPLPLHVLVISEMSTPHAVGGGETRYALLTRQLVQQGHTVTWLSMRQRQSPDDETHDGVRHRHAGPRITHPPVRPLWAKLRFMASICSHLLRHRYDVVDCQSYAPLPAAWIACKLRRMPMVATIHDTAAAGPSKDQWLSGFDRRLATLVERRLYRIGYDQVLTGSEAVKSDFVLRFGLRAERVAAVPNGIDVAAIAATPAHAEPVDLVFAGRLIPHKHPADVLRVLARLNAQRQQRGEPALRAKFVGGGPLKDALQAQAVEFGVAEHCTFCGELERHEAVIAHIRSARVLVLPSTREGFGLVLVEAMAGGTAVAAYDIPAVRDTLGPGLAGCLAAPGDIAALADIVAGLLDDPQRRARCLATGQQRVAAHFGVQAFAGKVAAVYAQTVARHRLR